VDNRECYENTEGRINRVHKMLDNFSYTSIEQAAIFELKLIESLKAMTLQMLYKIEQDILVTYEGIQLP
jgi:hypothetical protein